MNNDTHKRAKLVGDILDQLFPDPRPSLHFTDAFTLLTAVMLSAQCRDERVNEATAELFKVANSPQRMAALGEAGIYQYIRSLGLAKNKSKYLHEMSQQLIDHFHGQVPADFKGLESLAGVGHKTASVVMLQAFNIPAFPVDTHILRLSQRWGLSQGQTPEKVEVDLKRLFPAQDWGKRHLQFIECGRRYCKALGHKKEECPVCQGLLLVRSLN